MSYPRGKIRELTASLSAEERDRLDDLLDQVEEDRAHRNAEDLRNEARRVEEENDGKRGEVYKWYIFGARKLRRAAEGIDPYDKVAGTDILIRKSDGRHVIRRKVQ